ncbi:MAG: hypothetical protein L0226_05800 [Acidobacteria bacterium]|nr:hypothetical protein [Acidobacteriota bacterium]
MHPHTAEIDPESRLEERPNGLWQRLPSTSQRMEVCSDFRADFWCVSRGGFGLEELVFFLFFRLCRLALEQWRKVRCQSLALNSFFLLTFRTKALSAGAGSTFSLNLRRAVRYAELISIRHAHDLLCQLVGFLFVPVTRLVDFEFSLDDATDSSITNCPLELQQLMTYWRGRRERLSGY